MKKTKPKLGRPKSDNPASVSVNLRITPRTRDLIEQIRVAVAAKEKRIISAKDAIVMAVDALGKIYGR